MYNLVRSGLNPLKLLSCYRQAGQQSTKTLKVPQAEIQGRYETKEHNIFTIMTRNI